MYHGRVTRSFLSLLLFVSACAARDAATLQLADGRRVSELAVSDSTALLLYDPSACFSCGSTLPEWVAYRLRHPDRVRLVLTGEPTPGEAAQLRAGRIAVDGIAPGGRSLTRAKGYRVSLLVRGREVWSGTESPEALFSSSSLTTR